MPFKHVHTVQPAQDVAQWHIVNTIRERIRAEVLGEFIATLALAAAPGCLPPPAHRSCLQHPYPQHPGSKCVRTLPISNLAVREGVMSERKGQVSGSGGWVEERKLNDAQTMPPSHCRMGIICALLIFLII